MRAHLLAVAQVLALAAGVALSCFGWGSAAIRLLRLDRRSAGCAVLRIWVGWSMVLLLLQLLHLAVALTPYVGLALYAGGIPLAVVALLSRTPELPPAATRRRTGSRIAVGALCLVPLGAWVASRAMAPPLSVDYGNYYHATVQWLNAHPLIPGLGNLHARLAFNQSPFVFIASLNLHPSLGPGRVVALMFLAGLLVATVVAPIRKRAARDLHGGRRDGYEARCALFLLPFVAYIVVLQPHFASASPDLFSTAIQIAIFLLLCRGLDARHAGLDVRGELAVVALLAATAVTFKLSSLVFAAFAVALALAMAWRPGDRARAALAVAWLPLLTLGVWSFRGTVLSGMPLFPSTIGRLPLDWAVPRAEAERAANMIYSWARQPRAADWRAVLGGWDWLGPWLDRIASQVAEFVGPLLCLALLMLCLGLASLLRIRPWSRLELLLPVPPLAGAVFCMAMAPAPRFLGAQLWLLVVAVALLLARALAQLGPVWSKAAPPALASLLAAPLVVACLLDPALLAIRTEGSRQNLSSRGFSSVRRVELREMRNAQGIAYYVPRHRTEPCWDAPLLCVRHERPFWLRDERSVRSGFLGEEPR